MCISAVCVVFGLLFCVQSLCLDCPGGCECFAVTHAVKCISKDLLTVPQMIPGYAKTVVITGNNIHKIGPDSFTELENISKVILSNNRMTEMGSHSFSTLIHLRFLDLSDNQLSIIHPEALSIPGSPLQELNLSRSLYNFTALTDLTTALRWGDLRGLLRLDLSGNQLALLPLGMFSHLQSLQQLFLSNNSLMAVYSGTFSGVNNLEVLDLTRNAFRTFGTDDLKELEKLGNIRILLGKNPYICSCEIQSFVAWLNDSRARVDADSVRCASPKTLANSRLRGLGSKVIGCIVPNQTEMTDLSLQTSYVFLGLVLGFVGMVFLFVLYLNRKGMKRWIVEMRDACHDVMEGYHYRYEIDSDPRLGHISDQNGVSRARQHVGVSLSQLPPNDTCIITEDAHVKPLKSPSEARNVL
ncbi:trophoblast glycoprotein-like isoform X1 [Syngnathus typhle]|uniref:trophoblast glycoprotein-like isoform X1 n=1 Tax=Syngnathus typhle TaxID=161592 RepID=UPI002A6AF4F9|nr:trophoblast glycoprotein-like isoform X1 [Syngnathus typhle]